MIRTWAAPGAGQWTRDDSHITSVMTGYLAAVFLPAQLEGFAAGFREIGALLDGFDQQWVHGRAYQRPRIVGAPKQAIWGDQIPAVVPRPGKPPPRFVFKLLFALHPELRRRARRAATVWRDRTWRDVVARWDTELRPAAIAKNRELQRVAIDSLDDAALAEHLLEVTAEVRAATVEHFRCAPIIAVVVGDLLERAAAWTGATPNDVLVTLRGASPASRAGAVDCARIASAIAAAPEQRALLTSQRPPAEIVAALRVAPGAIGKAMNGYLEHHGLRLVTGVDLVAQPLLELPELIVRGIRAMLDTREADADGHDALARLRARTPEVHRAELDDAHAEAARTYGMRDDNTGLLLWKLGLLRRALRAVGRTLAGYGAVHEAADVLDAKPDELVAALRGDGLETLADELRARAAHRTELDRDEPPIALGDAGPMPDPSSFPPAVARMQRAVATFLRSFESTRTEADGDARCIRGTGANPGVYEGRARVIRGPADFVRLEAGDVLIARHTSPAYNVLLPLLGAIVTDRGGVLSHAAIVAREYGIPAIVDTRDATTRVPDGARIRVDGMTGEVHVIGAETAAAVSARPPTLDAFDTVVELTESAPPVAPPATAGRIAALRDARAVEFGGKGRALAAAVIAGLPVPDGRALDADLVDRIALGDAAAIARVTSACAGLPAPWAVRSSAIGEDSTHASFAGQHATVLGVTSAGLVDAIARVRASGHSASALAYRKRMNVAGEPRMGVVVQTLLRPEISGVVFSRDPTAAPAAAGARLIEATWGLGEALVAGLVTPDRFRIRADGHILERAIGNKDVAIEARPDGGTAEVAIGADRAGAACIDDKRLAELVRLAARCEQLFGGPQDLEWAVAVGRLYLLQSRPMTGSPAATR